MIPLGLTLLTLGTAGLIINVGAWIDAHRAGRLTDRLTPRRRILVTTCFIAVLAGTTLVWTTLL